jgi:hypothetical protein
MEKAEANAASGLLDDEDLDDIVEKSTSRVKVTIVRFLFN